MVWSLLDFNEEHLAPVVLVEAGREDFVIGAVPSRGGIEGARLTVVSVSSCGTAPEGTRKVTCVSPVSW